MFIAKCCKTKRVRKNLHPFGDAPGFVHFCARPRGDEHNEHYATYYPAKTSTITTGRWEGTSFTNSTFIQRELQRLTVSHIRLIIQTSVRRTAPTWHTGILIHCYGIWPVWVIYHLISLSFTVQRRNEALLM